MTARQLRQLEQLADGHLAFHYEDGGTEIADAAGSTAVVAELLALYVARFGEDDLTRLLRAELDGLDS